MVLLRAFSLALLLASLALACGNTDTPFVDSSLPSSTIAVDGDPVVGGLLRARVSEDLEGAIVSWSWERCGELTGCLAIDRATGREYEPTEDDAWHILRAVGAFQPEGGSANDLSARIGPIVNPQPRPFSESLTLNDRTGRSLFVAPGVTKVSVKSECPVRFDMTISTPRLHGPPGTSTLHAEDIVVVRDLWLDSQGGELSLFAYGECEIDIAIEGRW